jgi:hypothetical protein
LEPIEVLRDHFRDADDEQNQQAKPQNQMLKRREYGVNLLRIWFHHTPPLFFERV